MKSDENQNLIKQIQRLKQDKNAVILVHYYQMMEVQEVADYTGDSLGLSVEASRTDKDVIVFCGVHFMAETAKILNPSKTVLLPVRTAGCPMADMVDTYHIEALKKRYPGAAVACYVNTTAAVKAASDICVTSANAVEVVRSLKERQVIFIPDKNLGNYVQKQVPEKEIITPDGYCYVHQKFSLDDVAKAKETYPDAVLVVHPECPPEVVALADCVCSTGGMLPFSKNTPADTIIVGTEMGMIQRLSQDVPGKTLLSLGNSKVCTNMKKTTIKSVFDSLNNNQYQITVPEAIAEKARISVERMLAVKK